jgi:hypothetical protein
MKAALYFLKTLGWIALGVMISFTIFYVFLLVLMGAI